MQQVACMSTCGMSLNFQPAIRNSGGLHLAYMPVALPKTPAVGELFIALVGKKRAQ